MRNIYSGCTCKMIKHMDQVKINTCDEDDDVTCSIAG